MIKRVAVTGARGSAGRVIVRALTERGWEVRGIDVSPPPNPYLDRTRVADLGNYGDAVANLQGVDAVVHFASNPWPDSDFVTGAERYRNNTLATFNVFQAACQLKIPRVVYASSETIQGNPFELSAPVRIPIMEDDPPRPESAYALSKLNAEQLADHMHRMHGPVFVGLRCANILYDVPGHYAGYDKLPAYWDDWSIRRETLWKYVDSADVANVVLAALSAELERSEVFNVSAADTIMNVPTRELFGRYFPDTAIAPSLGVFDTPASLEKAADLLGWQPQRSWRGVLAG